MSSNYLCWIEGSKSWTLKWRESIMSFCMSEHLYTNQFACMYFCINDGYTKCRHAALCVMSLIWRRFFCCYFVFMWFYNSIQLMPKHCLHCLSTWSVCSTVRYMYGGKVVDKHTTRNKQFSCFVLCVKKTCNNSFRLQITKLSRRTCNQIQWAFSM